MSWTSVADIRAQVQKLWDKGLLLACLVNPENEQSLFPRRLTLKTPGSAELSDRFEEVRAWIADLRRDNARYRLVMREVKHRTLGSNTIPDEIWIDTVEDALALIGKRNEAKRFAAVVEHTRKRQLALLPWLEKRPLRGLDLADDWRRLLDIVAWLQAHPHPGLYLRQVDILGVHSKFIESYRGVLSELFDIALPAEAIDANASGSTGFCRRYGFLDKPLRIRFRLLDPQHAMLPIQADQDITLRQDAFSQLNPKAKRVFITENEINFLAFPTLPDSMVIFGAGYGFEALAEAAWLQQRDIYYWGDIDTHGFAILDQLRSYFPQTHSFLMDRNTLMHHTSQWGEEPQPALRELSRLTESERALFEDLRNDRLCVKVRPEQERIGFGWVKAGLAALEG